MKQRSIGGVRHHHHNRGKQPNGIAPSNYGQHSYLILTDGWMNVRSIVWLDGIDAFSSSISIFSPRDGITNISWFFLLLLFLSTECERRINLWCSTKPPAHPSPRLLIYIFILYSDFFFIIIINFKCR